MPSLRTDCVFVYFNVFTFKNEEKKPKVTQSVVENVAPLGVTLVSKECGTIQ